MVLKSGIPINTQDQTMKIALYVAAECDFDEIVHLLLQNGANETITDGIGYTPFLHAVTYGIFCDPFL